MTAIHATESTFATTTRHPKLRSVGAVFGGLLATVVVTTAIDMILHASGTFPPVGEHMSDSLFVLALAYRLPLNVGGTYVAARLAPENPERHALALGAVGTVIAALGAVAMWNFGPAWYAIANVMIGLPCGWLGGRLAQQRHHGR